MTARDDTLARFPSRPRFRFKVRCDDGSMVEGSAPDNYSIDLPSAKRGFVVFRPAQPIVGFRVGPPS